MVLSSVSHWHLTTITENSRGLQYRGQLSRLCICLQEHPAAFDIADTANAAFSKDCDSVFLWKNSSQL